MRLDDGGIQQWQLRNRFELYLMDSLTFQGVQAAAREYASVITSVQGAGLTLMMTLEGGPRS